MPARTAHPFGALLRQYRLAAGLSQEQLAERAGLSAQAVGALERGVRRAPYRDTIRLLADALDLDPEDRRTLEGSVARARHAADALTATPAAARSRLSSTATTSFVGREAEQATVRRLLETARLVTLTGTGGIGKTRLATEVAAGLADRFPDGVGLVELAPLADPALVAPATAQVLGIREAPNRSLLDTLVETLREQRLLLLLDNCEHLREAVADLIATLLHACPPLRILATSREALGATGETVWWVPSLPVPEATVNGGPPRYGAASVLQAEAAQLFCTRAQAAHPAFVLTDANAPAVAAICRRLDGIPLALELAAARARVLTAEQIAARLDARFRLLTRGGLDAPPRHQTLRAVLDWSYDLLSEPECRLLRYLSVFPGGCDLEAAEAVCTDDDLQPDDLVDLLTDLTDKSLVIVEYQHETARYRLLETVRAYAHEHLASSGETDVVQRRRGAWALALAEHAAPLLNGPEQAVWFERLESEHDNLRTVLQWSAEQGENRWGLALATALHRFWLQRGHLTEGRGWLARLLACDEAVPLELRARALRMTAQLAMFQGDYDAAHANAEAALSLYQDLGDESGAGPTLLTLGQIAYFRSDFVAARDYAEACVRIARQIDDRRLRLIALSDLANAVQFQGDLDAARVHYEEAIAISRELGDLSTVSTLLGNLALLTIRQGNYAGARPLLEEALTLQRRIGGRISVPRQLSWLAMIAREDGDCATARRHLEEALSITREIGDLDAVAGTAENLADLERNAGDLATAAVHAAEALRLAVGLDDAKRHVTALLTAAKLAAALGRAREAARLIGAAQALQDAVGFIPFPSVTREVDTAIATLQGSLGETAFAELWLEGAAMTAQQALAVALADVAATSPSAG